MSEASVILEPWEQLAEVIDSDNAEYLAMFVQLLDPGDTAYTINRLDEARRTKMFSVLSRVRPDFAADLFEHFADEHAADIIEELPPAAAAAIVEEMDSDEQTDVLAEMHADDAAAILEHMAPEEAADARWRLEYAHDTAGGLMITDFIAVRAEQPVDAVVAQLREVAGSNQEYEGRYIYVVDAAGKLAGVVPIRNLVMSPRGTPTTQMMIFSPMTVNVRTTLDELEDLFDRVSFSAVPVLDEAGRLVGVVQRAAVREAVGEQQGESLAKFGGIIGGEELRTMPWLSRAMRRSAFLLPNVVLSGVSVVVILLYEPLIHKLTLLAVLLPLVANLSGAAGNQSVAVSIRELALGLVRPADWGRVCAKEAGVGLVNGLFIGLLLGAAAVLLGWMSTMLGWMESDARVGLLPMAGVITLAYMLNSVLAVVIGGTIPLALKRAGVDPAMASSPILTTITDMCSFLITLTFALAMLHLWTGGG